MTTLGKYYEGTVYAAIKALESERFFDFSEGLIMLLNEAKRTDRLLSSVLDGAAGGNYENREKYLQEANADNTWWEYDKDTEYTGRAEW